MLSGRRHLLRHSGTVLRLVESIASTEGFRVNEAKTRVLTAGQRQTVTGIVVNQRSNVARPDDDRLRAVLHDAACAGPEQANRSGHPDFRSHLLGRIAWVGAENDARAEKLRRAFSAIER